MDSESPGYVIDDGDPERGGDPDEDTQRAAIAAVTEAGDVPGLYALAMRGAAVPIEAWDYAQRVRDRAAAFTAEGITPPSDIRVVSFEDFGSVDEPGAEPLLGTEDEVVLPRGGDAMLYGLPGSNKSTLAG